MGSGRPYWSSSRPDTRPWTTPPCPPAGCGCTVMGVPGSGSKASAGSASFPSPASLGPSSSTPGSRVSQSLSEDSGEPRDGGFRRRSLPSAAAAAAGMSVADTETKASAPETLSTRVGSSEALLLGR